MVRMDHGEYISSDTFTNISVVGWCSLCMLLLFEHKSRISTKHHGNARGEKPNDGDITGNNGDEASNTMSNMSGSPTNRNSAVHPGLPRLHFSAGKPWSYGAELRYSQKLIWAGYVPLYDIFLHFWQHMNHYCSINPTMVYPGGVKGWSIIPGPRWKACHNQSCLSTCEERVHHPMQIACRLRVFHHGDMGFLCKQIGCCIGSRGLKVWTKINGGRDSHKISVCFFEDTSHNAFLFENPSWSQSRWHRFASCWSVSGCFWHHIWSIRIPAHPLILVCYFPFFNHFSWLGEPHPQVDRLCTSLGATWVVLTFGVKHHQTSRGMTTK